MHCFAIFLIYTLLCSASTTIFCTRPAFDLCKLATATSLSCLQLIYRILCFFNL